MLLLHTPSELAPWAGCALVPTMGALHAGHVSLVEQAAASGRPAVVTIFVNPTQFAPTEDFAAYPRTLQEDLLLAKQAGAAAVFAPSFEHIYPMGAEAARREAERWELPRVATAPQLEDASRPAHFGGVCQVVARLFDLARPSRAFFGRKDFQQLCVVSAMVQQHHQRWPGLTIQACPTIRDSDGLALSSRNRYLHPAQRTQALGLCRALETGATLIQSSNHHADAVPSAEAAMRQTLLDHLLAPEYAVIRDAHTLEPPLEPGRPLQALIAARLGSVRLIDNRSI